MRRLPAVRLPAPMRRLLDLALIAVGHALFGVSVVTLAFLVVPAALLLPGDSERRSLRMQRVLHLSCWVYLKLLIALGLIEFGCDDEQRLRSFESGLVVANHPSLIDVLVLLALFPQLDLIAKPELWANPVLGRLMCSAGYPSGRAGESALAFMERCAERVAAGRRMLIFPEGTRSHPGSLGEFRSGAAAIAVVSRCRILPIVMNCDPPILTKVSRWYEIPSLPVRLQLQICSVIDTVAVAGRGSSQSVARRRLTEHLHDFYLARLGNEQRTGAGTKAIHNRNSCA